MGMTGCWDLRGRRSHAPLSGQNRVDGTASSIVYFAWSMDSPRLSGFRLSGDPNGKVSFGDVLAQLVKYCVNFGSFFFSFLFSSTSLFS